MAPASVTTAEQYRQSMQGRAQVATAVVVALSLGTLMLLLASPPGWLAVILWASVAFVAVVWVRPVIGVAMVLGATLLFEQFDFASFEVITRQPFFDNASSFTPIGIDVSPLEAVLVTTVTVVVARSLARHDPLRENRLAAPVAVFGIVLLAALVHGSIAGGALNIALWEVRALAYFVLLALLVPQCIETERDVRLVMWVAAGMVVAKSAQGLWNYFVVLRGDLAGVRSVTSHEDALFIAWTLVFLVALLVMRSGGGQRWFLLAAGPVLLAAFAATDRRAAYVALVVGLIALAAFVATDTEKRALVAKTGVPLLITAAFLVMAGWNATGPLGRPAAVIKSITAPDNQEDVDSNYYRRAEEVNLMHAIESAPVFGLGFGRPFQAEGSLARIRFSLADVIAHNEIMWLWAKTGTVGFAIFWALVGGMIAFGGVVFRAARRPYLRALAATVACAVAMQVVVSYVDLQLTYARNMVFLGVLVGLLARLPALDEDEVAS